jgi:hypothetical protein
VDAAAPFRSVWQISKALYYRLKGYAFLKRDAASDARFVYLCQWLKDASLCTVDTRAGFKGQHVIRKMKSWPEIQTLIENGNAYKLMGVLVEDKGCDLFSVSWETGRKNGHIADTYGKKLMAIPELLYAQITAVMREQHYQREQARKAYGDEVADTYEAATENYYAESHLFAGEVLVTNNEEESDD